MLFRSIVPGEPVFWKAILPSLRRAGGPFRLCLKGEDAWGNPSGRGRHEFTLSASCPIEGLPERAVLPERQIALVLENLRVATSGDVIVSLLDAQGEVRADSNPLRIVTEAALLP